MSDYDFIINNQPKRSGFSMGQNSLQKKVMMFGFVAVVLILAIVIFSTIMSSGKPSASAYVPITVYQEELLRILNNRDRLSDQDLKPKYTTLYLALNSDYQESTEYLSRNGLKITPELRTPYYYSNLEADLETASSANRFDEEFISYVDRAVADYSQALLSLEPTPGQAPLLEQAKQTIIYYNGPAVGENTEE